MAGPGRTPKEQRARADDTKKRQAEMRHVSQDGELRGFPLPDGVLAENQDWHPATQAWWQTWRESAQAQKFTETDWRFLLDTALMHHTMWSKGRWEYAGEIRLRVGKFGATPEDRMRLKLSVDTPADPAPEEPSAEQNNAAGRRKDLRIVG